MTRSALDKSITVALRTVAACCLGIVALWIADDGPAVRAGGPDPSGLEQPPLPDQSSETVGGDS